MKTKEEKERLFYLYPDLKDEWLYSENEGIDPDKLAVGSAKSVWWVCSEGHQWKTQVRVRTKNKSGCVTCRLNEIVKGNPLSQSQELTAQLDDPNYTAGQLSMSSTKKVWWKCEKSHRWKAAVAPRYHGKVGCPYCSGRLPIIGETDLATLRPDLVLQWHDDRLSPTEVTLRSTQRVSWKCSSGHVWMTSVTNRTSSRTKGSGCPYCPGSRGQHAKVLAGVNDLATLRPDVAAELHSDTISAQELREYSGKKLEWKCSQGHIWSAPVRDRSLGSGCPQCSIVRSSKIERRLRHLVSSKDYLSGTVLEDNHKLPVPCRNRKSVSVDIFCKWKGKPVVIEYDGAYWHHRDSSRSRDVDKTTALLEHGYLVIRVRENSLPLLEMDHENLLQLNVQYSANEDTNLEEAISEIESWLEKI